MLLVTGATGALGTLVAKELAGRDDVVFGTRTRAPRSSGASTSTPRTPST